MIRRKKKSITPLVILILAVSAFIYSNQCYSEEIDTVHEKDLKWESIVFSAGELNRAINNNADYLEKYINDDEQTLRIRLNTLKNELDKNTVTLAKLREELETKIKTHEDLETEFDNASSDMKTLEGTVRTTARQCLEQFKLSPVSFIHSDRFSSLESFLVGKSFPSLKDISAISQILFEEIRQTGATFSNKGDFIGPSGEAQSGTIIMAGGFFLGYSDGNNTGFLTPAEPIPIAVQGLPQSYSRIIDSWLKGDSNSLSMDITRGAALEAQARRRNFSQWFEAGGILLWPIFAVAIGGILVILYKVFYLFTRRRLSANTFAQLEKHLKEDNREKCEELLFKIRRTPAASVLVSGIKFCNASLDALDNGLQEANLNILAKLERMLPFLGVLAAIAPLLGLLGTVTGMISTFQTITIFGTGDPRMLSTGISEALITTQAGLGITIPFLLIHHLLKRRVNTLMNDIEETSAGFAAFIADLQHTRKNQDIA